MQTAKTLIRLGGWSESLLGAKFILLVFSCYGSFFIFVSFQKLSINGDQEVIAELLAQGIKPSYPQERAGESVLPIKLKVQRI